MVKNTSIFDVIKSIKQKNQISIHFQQRMSWLPQRWRTQRNAIRNANRTTSESSNFWTHLALREFSRGACLMECLFSTSILFLLGVEWVCDFLSAKMETTWDEINHFIMISMFLFRKEAGHIFLNRFLFHSKGLFSIVHSYLVKPIFLN